MMDLEFESYLNELTDIIEDFADIDVIKLKEFDASLLNDTKLLKVVKIKPRKKIFKSSYYYCFLRDRTMLINYN